jgi:hypothetical protein
MVAIASIPRCAARDGLIKGDINGEVVFVAVLIRELVRPK